MADIDKRVRTLWSAMSQDGKYSGSVESFNDQFFQSGKRGYEFRYGIYKQFKDAGADVGKDYHDFSKRFGLHATSPKASSGSIYDRVNKRINDARQTVAGVDPTSGAVPVANAVKAMQDDRPMTDAERRQMMQSADNIIGSTDLMKQQWENQKKYREQRMQRTGLIAPTPESIRLGQNPNVVKQKQYNPETGKIEDTYLTSEGNVYANRFEADREQDATDDFMDRQLNPIEAELRDAYAERDRLEEMMKNRNQELGATAYGTYYGGAAGMNATEDKEWEQLSAAYNKNKALITTLEDKRNNAMNDYFHTLGNEITNGYNFTLGLADAIDSNAIAQAQKHIDSINKKRENGEKLTHEEEVAEAVLKNMAWDNDVQARYGDEYGMWADAAKMTATSADLMAEFLLTGGMPLSLARSVMNGVVKGGVKLLGKGATKGLGKYMLKTTGATLGSMVAGAEMANTVGVGRTGNDIVKRYTGDVLTDENGNYVLGHYDENNNIVAGGDTLLDAVLSAERQGISEYGSEVAGGLFPNGGKLLTKGLEKIGLDKLSKFLTTVSGKEWYKAYSKALETLGFNGVAGEGLEEYAGTAFDAMMGGDEWKNLTDPKTHINIWLGCLTMSAFMNAPRATATAYQYGRYKAATNKSDKVAERQLGEEWQNIRSRIDNTKNEDMASVVYDVLNNNELAKEQKTAVMDYIKNLQQLRGFTLGEAAVERGGEEKAPEEQSVDQSYTQGYNAESNEDKQDVKNDLDDKADALLQFADESTLNALDEDGIGTLKEIMARDDWSDEQKQAALDYVNAKATYEGMIDRVKDDIETEVADSDAAIDRRVASQEQGGDGMIHPATMAKDNRQVDIISGNVVMSDDGSMVDTQKSDKDIIVRDRQTGKVEFANPKEIKSVEAPIDAEALKASERERITNERAQAASNAIDGVLPMQQGDQYTLTYNGEQHQVQVVQDNGDGTVSVIIDGAKEPQDMAKEQLQDLANQSNRARLEQSRQQAQQQQAPIEETPTETTAETPTTTTAEIQETTPEEAPTEAAPEEAPKLEGNGLRKDMPMREDGNPAFMEVTPERTQQFLYGEESGMTEDEATQFVDKNIAAAEKALEEVKKGAPKVGTDFAKFKAEKAAYQQQLDAAQAAVDYWNNVKAARQAAMAAPVAQQAPVEQNAPEAVQPSEVESNATPIETTQETAPEASVESAEEKPTTRLKGSGLKSKEQIAEEQKKKEEQKAAEQKKEEEKKAKRQEKFRKRAESWSKKTGVKVNIIDNVDDVENAVVKSRLKNGSKVKGWWQQSNNEIYIYLPNMESMDDVDETFIHEAVAHRGLRHLLGEEEFGKLCDKVFDAMSPKAKARELKYVGVSEKDIKEGKYTDKQKRAAADEFMAKMSEHTDLNPTLWEQICNWIREALGRTIDVDKVKMSNESIQRLIRASYAHYQAEAKKAAANEEVSTMGEAADALGDTVDVGATRFNMQTEETLQKNIKEWVDSGKAKKEGWTKEKVSEIVSETADLIRAIHNALSGDDFYKEWSERNPSVRVDWRDGVEKPTVTWTRGNIEYKYDMSADLLCINNEGLESVLASPTMVELMMQMQKSTDFTSEDYLTLYETLRDLGFVVPCKGCFDAAARLKMLPSVSQKFVDLVNKTIDERNKDVEAFDNKLKEKAKKAGNALPNGLPNSASNKEDAVAIGVAGDNLTKHITWTQLMSAKGQTKALYDWGGIFRAWQKTGAGRPKDKLLPEPYRGDIISPTSTIIASYGSKTPSYNKEDVNVGTGLRRNSHAEFRPLLGVDEIQFMRDAYLHNLMVFKYMKELDDVRLFGQLGVKFNMSFFPAFVKGAPAAGLDADGNYIASEESVGSREFEYKDENGKTHYDGMKGFEEAQKYINENVSLSSVVFSIPHLIKAFTDVPTRFDWRGIWGSLIPFHASGATAASLAIQGLGRARALGVGHPFSEAFTDYDKGVTNFEDVQNDRFGEGWVVVSGKKAGNAVEAGHKIEFANGTHYYNKELGLHLFSTFYIYDNEIPESITDSKGEKVQVLDKDGNIIESTKVKGELKKIAHPFYIDYNDKVREIGTDYAYDEAATELVNTLRSLGLVPRFDFNVPEDVFLKMCEDANVDPKDPKLGWKGEGNGWSPVDSPAYYSLWCDYGMTDPATGKYSPHRPVGYIDENGERSFRMPDNTIDIIRKGVERYSTRKNTEEKRVNEAINEFAKRSVERGKISKEDADRIINGGENAETRFREGDTFYSPAERAVENIKQEKATGEQWLKMIEKNGGLKKEEDKWMGLSDFLKDKKSLTKQEVLDFIRENQVEVQDVEYNEAVDLDNNPQMQKFRNEFNELVSKYETEKADIEKEADAFNDEMFKKYGKGWANDPDRLSEEDRLRNDEMINSWDRLNDPYDRAFRDMVDNYGDDFEMAFEVNYGSGELEPQMDMYGDSISDAANYYLELNEQPINSTRLTYTTEGLENKKEIALVVPTIESWNEGDEIHFGDAGEGRAVAWIRFGETTDADGNRVLVIDEIQSKRHQEGREKGYKNPTVYKDATIGEYHKTSYGEEADIIGANGNKIGTMTKDADGYYATDNDGDNMTSTRSTEAEALQAMDNAFSGSGIPDAPFQKNWHELAMKRMLRYAAENGYDKVAWTKGEQQAKRYSLSTTISKIEKERKNRDITYVDLTVADTNGIISLEVNNDGIVEGVNQSRYNDFVGEPLSNVIGKEWANEVLNSRKRTFNTGEIAIGGEGMKGFYDQMLPRFMDKYGKKWGVKTGEVELPNVEEAGRTMWSVDVTPEMKDSVMEGQTMFRVADDMKKAQMDIISKNNPADESLGEHTWIKSVDDIKTFDEAMTEYGENENLTPDYTADMARKAKETGKITVYSSKPIDNGIFVTPSKMEAKNYAGEGEVYSKKVRTSDVAWIDGIQGQYAKVEGSQPRFRVADDITPEEATEKKARKKAKKNEGEVRFSEEEPKYIDPRNMPYKDRKRRGDELRTISAIEVKPNQIVSKEGKSARKVAEEWWDTNVGEPHWYDTEVGKVEINRNTVESSLAHRYGQKKLDAITSLVDGFKNAVYLGTLKDADRRATFNHFFAYPIMYNGKRCYVFCRALHDNNTNRLYIHEVFVGENIKKGNTLQTAAFKPHGGIALYRDILANVLDSDSKDNTNISNTQEKSEENDNISFRITPEEDAEYMDAVEKRDIKKAQQMVLEAAKKAMPDTKVVDEGSEPMIVYHGTNDDFTIFNRELLGLNTDVNASDENYAKTAHIGFWFTSEGDGAVSTISRKMMPCYLNLENPLRFTSLESLADEMSNYDTAEDFVNEMKEQGYDGVILDRDEEMGGESYAVFEPNQIKSAEPITYDNNGKPIPLSERFNEGNDDIRFRVSDERRRREYAERQWKRAHNKAANTIKSLGISDNVTVVDTPEELAGYDSMTEQQKASKGWYDENTGNIVVIVGNHTSPEDVQRTILREGVARYGLRQLFGQNFNNFLDNVLTNAESDIRREIVNIATRNGYDFRKATEEYLARLANDTDFERAMKQGWWSQIKSYFLDMLHSIGLADWIEDDLSDNELRYMLWRSYMNLTEPNARRNPFNRAREISMRDNLKVGDYSNIEDELPVGNFDYVAEQRIRKLVSEMPMSEVRKAYERINEKMRDEDGLDIDEHMEKVREDWRNEHGSDGIGKVMADDVQMLRDKYGDGLLTLRNYLRDRIENEGEVRFSIRGEKGAANDATAMANLDVAKEMENAGEDTKKIWLATGWEKGKDGKWRNEIPDAKAKAVDPKKAKSIEDLVDAPELFEVYPELKEYKVQIKNMSLAGSVNHEDKMISLDTLYNTEVDMPEDASAEIERQTLDYIKNGRWRTAADVVRYKEKLKAQQGGKRRLNEEGLRTIIHEMQHAVQRIEGFAKGGNVSLMEADIMQEEQRQNPLLATFAHDIAGFNSAQKLISYGKQNMVNLLRRGLNNEGMTDEHKQRVEQLIAYLEGITEAQYKGFVKNAKSLWTKVSKQAKVRYNNLAGEVEARNTEKRSGMTDEERRETPLSATEDVKRDEQLIRFRLDEDAEDTEESSEGSENSEENEEPLEAIDYNAGDMTLEEAATNALIRLAKQNERSLSLRIRAMHSIGGNLTKLRRAMAQQRKYDRKTVDSIVRLARMLMNTGDLNNFTRGEVKKLMSMVNRAAGKEDITKQADAVVDMMINHQLKAMEEMLHKQMKVKGSKLNQKGVEVQGALDITGQRTLAAFKDGIGIDYDTLQQRIEEAAEKMTSDNQVEADNARAEWTGYLLAERYHESILVSETEESNLRQELKQAKEDLDAGRMTREAYNEFVKTTQNAIRENRLERIKSYEDMLDNLTGNLREAVARAKEWQEKEQQRVEEIHHNANSDLEGVPMLEHGKQQLSLWDRVKTNPLFQFFLKPVATFDQLLRFFGSKSIDGRGYLFNRFMPQFIDSTQNEWKGFHSACQELDEKASEVFGKKMVWSDIFEEYKKMPTVTVEFWDNGEMREHELTQGNLLYIYAVNKMSDGKMKLRKMGITEEDVTAIEEKLDPRLKQLIDWVQDDFLVRKREDYNKVYERMFGAPMAAIENYFPLKVLERSIDKVVEIGDDANTTERPTTVTGSIIKRTRNSKPLDITGADAFDVVLEHVQQMEHWAAFAEFCRDINTLLSYKRFRNKVENMVSARFGKGKDIYKSFVDTCAIAADAYNPKYGMSKGIDDFVLNGAKLVTMAKISGRIWTAIKQVASYPAYFSEANIAELAKTANPMKWREIWKWAIENLPTFAKRWESRQAGDQRLDDTDVDWGWLDKAMYFKKLTVKNIGRIGMKPNAFVDAMTVCIGAKAIYETKKKNYLEMGFNEEQAEKKALRDAAIALNETQQSGENAFLSPIQRDRTAFAVGYTVFRNSSMGYQRRYLSALSNLKRRMRKGYKEESIAFMQKQLVREGLSEEQAQKAAERMYERNWVRDVVDVIIFGHALQFLWNVMPNIFYILMGDDGDEKLRELDDAAKHSLAGGVEGLTGGSILSDLYNKWRNGDDLSNYNFHLLPLMSDIQTTLNHFEYDKVAAINDFVNLMMQSVTGLNPQTLTDAAVAAWDYLFRSDLSMREFGIMWLRIMQAPQSTIDNMYIDDLGMTGKEARNLTVEEAAKRYAWYKYHRNQPWTGMVMSDEYADERKDKYIKRYEKVIAERMAKMSDEDLQRNFDEFPEDRERRKLAGKEIAKRVGGSDTYGNPQTAYGVVYAETRNYTDLAEDVLLQTEQKKAKQNGETEREKDINKARNRINKLKESLPETPITLEDGTKVTKEDIMNEIRELRSEYLKEFGIKK